MGQKAARNISATSCGDETTDGRGWQITEWNWQHRTLLHPPRRTRRKLPNLVGPHPIRNVEPTHSDERVAKHSEATRQSPGVPRREVASNQGNTVRNRIIAEYTSARSSGGKLGTARAV